MAHWSYLRSCNSPQEAVADGVPDDGNGTVGLDARYAIPLFWLAAFDVKNIMRPTSGEPLVLCASGDEAANRLRSRAVGIAKLLPAVYAPYLDEWIRFVKTFFPHYLVLRAEDILSMEDIHDSELRLTAAVRSLSPADDGKPIKEIDALDYFGGFRSLFDSRPSDEPPAIMAMRIRTQLAGFNHIESTALDGWPRSPTAAELTFIGGMKVDANVPLAPDQAHLTATIRNGVGANTLREGFDMAVGKLSGRIPLGADAPTKTWRKAIGGSGELFELLRSGFMGLLGLLLGPVFLWVGFSNVIQWGIVAVGAVLLVMAVFLLRSAIRAFRNLRTIMRA